MCIWAMFDLVPGIEYIVSGAIERYSDVVAARHERRPEPALLTHPGVHVCEGPRPDAVPAIRVLVDLHVLESPPRELAA